MTGSMFLLLQERDLMQRLQVGGFIVTNGNTHKRQQKYLQWNRYIEY